MTTVNSSRAVSAQPLPQLLRCFRLAPRHHRQAFAKHRPPHRRRPADLTPPRPARLQKRRVPPRQLPQRRFRPPRDYQYLFPRFGLRLPGTILFPALHHHVRVGTAETKRTHPANPTTTNRLPLPRLRHHLQRQLAPTNVLARTAPVQLTGDHSVLQAQHHLDQTRHSCRRLQMTHVGLHRANQKLAPTFAPLPKHRTQRFGFDRVAQRRSRSVRLHIPHLPGFDPRSTVSRTKQRLLRQSVRYRQAARRSVLIHR